MDSQPNFFATKKEQEREAQEKLKENSEDPNHPLHEDAKRHYEKLLRRRQQNSR